MPQFDVQAAIAVRKQLRNIHKQAVDEGRGANVVSAYRTILEKLHSVPGDFGEPLYRLPVMKMQIRTAIVRPIAVHYGLCEDEPLVIIKGLSLLPIAEH